MTPNIDEAVTSGPSLYEAFASPNSRVPMTCVFIDMVNSTGMKASTPESGWLPQLGFLYDVTVGAFGQLDDVTLKFLGDGVVAFLPGDDRGVEAIQSSIAVQHIVQDAARPFEGALGKINFHVTIGVTTGVAHRFATPDGHIDFVGVTVDRAARLCTAASAQAIFVDKSTVSATNFNRVSSPLGGVTHRTPDDYQGERQSITLKGIPTPVEYHEILWDAQLYGVKSELLTLSSNVRNEERHTIAPTTNQPAAAAGKVERLVGSVKSWNEEKGFGFVTSTAGEDFFFSRLFMVYPEDIETIRPGKKVAFVAVAPIAEGKSRRAGALLVVDEYADGVLVSLPGTRSYSWIEVHDKAGNVQPIFVSDTQLTGDYHKGQLLSFKVESGPRGVQAADVGIDDGQQTA
jgi:class 3 adenylate cyclase/cold shock CspA family protein